MRITENDKKNILETVAKVFGSKVSVYLFGSRVDDSKRGGDIDLYIKSDKPIKDKLNKKIKFLVEVEKKIGEQKIDLVINSDSKRLIERIAVSEGIRL
jgi:predicted nucleotidyltransferase